MNILNVFLTVREGPKTRRNTDLNCDGFPLNLVYIPINHKWLLPADWPAQWALPYAHHHINLYYAKNCRNTHKKSSAEVLSLLIAKCERYRRFMGFKYCLHQTWWLSQLMIYLKNELASASEKHSQDEESFELWTLGNFAQKTSPLLQLMIP